MRLQLAVAITTERSEGRTVYKCATVRGAECSARDPVLSAALTKVAAAARKSIGSWIEAGKPARVSPWLHDSGMKGSLVRLVLSLRDRTLRCKLLMVTWPLGDRIVAMATTVPDVVFELASLSELEKRAEEVYTQWCNARLKDEDSDALADISLEGDGWLDTLEVEAESRVRPKKTPKNIFAALMGRAPVSGSEELNKVGHCLDYMAAEYQSAIGRKELVDEIDQVLRRRDRQGVMVIGPPAVGKTAIIQECIKRRTERFQNRRGRKPQTWWISPQRLVSGMMYLGQWEQRWLAILREATRRDHILVIEDLVGLYTAGLTRDSRLCAADVLKSYLSEQRVRILAETTPEELAVLRRRDRSLADRFHLVHVPSLSPADTLPVLLEATCRVETQKNVHVHPGVVPLAIQQQEVFAPNRAFPGKAIELVKALCDTGSVVTPATLLEHLHQRTGTNLRLLHGHLGTQSEIEELLRRKVIGQPQAVAAMARLVVRFTQRLQPSDRPVGVLLFLGPTGVGKTESAKALTELLFSHASHMIRIDMNEITTSIAAEQLVGTFEAPEGRLTSAVRRQPHSVILLDEIEKAHPDVFDYLLQVLGEGRMTDARGRVVDFRNSIIVLTSNLGSTHHENAMGFDGGEPRQAELAFQRAAEKFFRPEFFNRLDEVIAFRSLSRPDIQAIVLIQLRQLLMREGLKRRHVFVRIEQAALAHVVQVGYDKHLGARAVRRALEHEIVQPLGDQLAELSVDSPVLIRVSRVDGQLQCRVLDLVEVQPPAATPAPSLEQVVQQAKPKLERFEAQLAEANAQLKANSAGEQTNQHQVTYYTLHEQVFRCNQLLRAARYRLSLSAEPQLNPMQGTPASVKRSSTSHRGGRSRRMLRQWMAEEDLRETIAEPPADASHLDMPLESLAAHLRRQLSLTQLMLESIDQPRRWLFGMETLSRPEEPTEGTLAAEMLKYFLEPEIYFYANLIDCLEKEWQYDVTNVPGMEHYRIIAGVSVAGLLQALAGTYVVEGRGQGRDLCVLRALPIASDQAPDGLAEWLAQRPVLSANGFEPPPPGLSRGYDVIRGQIGSEIVDLVTGQRINLAREWPDDAPDLQQWANWWIDALGSW